MKAAASIIPELYSKSENTPEWLRQLILISQGVATWEDFTFEERTCKGWLIPALTTLDLMFTKRWDYWSRTVENNSLLDEKIPYINFCGGADPEALKNIETCLKRFVNRGVQLVNFLDWLLWGFGESKHRPKIDSDVNEFWYKTFNLGLLLQSPHDYFADILQESKSGYWNNPNAFFATPHHICEMMIQMNLKDGDNRTKSVCDPCVGTGRMLLHASNHSLFLYGQDIDLICCKASTINGFLYMPWAVRPGLKHLQKKPEKIVEKQEKNLKQPIQKTKEKAIQLTLFN